MITNCVSRFYSNLISKSRSHLKFTVTLSFYVFTAQKMKFSIKNFFSKCDQIRNFLQLQNLQYLYLLITSDLLFSMLSSLCRAIASFPFITPITRKHVLKFASRCLQTMQSNHQTNLAFIQERPSRKYTGRAPGYMRPLLQTWWHYHNHTILNCLQDKCGYLCKKRKRERDWYI